MSDLRKAAEMGLEALEEAASCVQHSYLPDSMGHDWDEQIEALRQALAQPEQYDQTALELCEKCGWKAIMPDEGCLVCAREELR